MDIKIAIKMVTEGNDLSRDQMIDIMRIIMTGKATDAQIGGFLIGLRMKGETVNEIVAAAGVMRGLSEKVEVDSAHLVDTCGTGGDGASTFNISTASALVAAAAGAQVAKHGNRSVSSQSGSADLLEKAGVNLSLSADKVAQCIIKTGVGFMFAPMHHSAMKHAIGPRKEMAVRTIFNLLGPLTNPADAPNQVLGVFSKEWLVPLAEVLKELGSEHVLVVHAQDGMDEISIGSKTFVAELVDNKIESYEITPEQFGLQQADVKTLKVDDAQQSLALIKRIFAGETGPATDIVALNAGAAIYVSGLAASLNQGVEKAISVMSDGSAQKKFDELITVSNQ